MMTSVGPKFGQVKGFDTYEKADEFLRGANKAALIQIMPLCEADGYKAENRKYLVVAEDKEFDGYFRTDRDPNQLESIIRKASILNNDTTRFLLKNLKAFAYSLSSPILMFELYHFSNTSNFRSRSSGDSDIYAITDRSEVDKFKNLAEKADIELEDYEYVMPSDALMSRQEIAKHFTTKKTFKERLSRFLGG